MSLKPNRILQTMAGAAMAIALMAGAQTPAPPPATPDAAPAACTRSSRACDPAAPAAPTWSVGPMDISGFIDGYYSFNFNRPNTTDGYDQINQLYNFNDKTDQFELERGQADAEP